MGSEAWTGGFEGRPVARGLLLRPTNNLTEGFDRGRNKTNTAHKGSPKKPILGFLLFPV